MCMVDGADDGEYEHLSEGSPVARKPHRCDDCGRTIRPGERYHWSRWAVEGSVVQETQCRHCRAAASWLTDRCGGWLWPAVGEDLFEHWDAGCDDHELLRLIVGWRKDWTRRDGTLMPEPRTIPKPRRVYVDGRLEYDSYEGDGVVIPTAEVTVRAVVLLRLKSAAAALDEAA